MSTMLVTEAMNLFCGTGDPSASKHLTLAEIKLPDMTEVFADHNAGGGRVGIEIGVGIEKLGATFKLNGDEPRKSIPGMRPSWISAPAKAKK
jgi:phage tail tube protein FII